MSESPRPEPTVPAPSRDELPPVAASLELIEQARRGDAGALDALFRRYETRLLRIVRARMGTRLRRFLEPEDLLQEVFLVALRKLDGFEPQDNASLLNWLGRIAERRIYDMADFFAARKRDPGPTAPLARHSGHGSQASGVRVEAEGPTPSQLAVRSELEELMDACVDRLEPEDYKQVILLRDYCGGDWEFVRRELDRPTVQAAQELHRRAQIRLRSHLRRYVDQEEAARGIREQRADRSVDP